MHSFRTVNAILYDIIYFYVSSVICVKITYTLNLAILSFQCSSSAVGPMSSASFLILEKRP